MEDLITVVIPVYNVEKYLDRCINSVVSQSYSNLEIILVDDGSPDNCPAMCDEWSAQDGRIKVIHKQNAGLGMARNTGIENAHGKYICFFDSDDYISLEIIEKAYALAERESADIVCFGSARVVDGDVIKELIPNGYKYVYEGEEVQNLFLPDLIDPVYSKTLCCSNLSLSACSTLFSMDLIKRADWRFVSEREFISEDTYSILNLYNSVERVAVIPEIGYYYCLNDTSLTQTYRRDRFERIKSYYFKATALCKEMNYNKDVFQRLERQFLGFTIATLKQLVSSNEELKNKIILMNKIISDEVLQKILVCLNQEGYNLRLKMFFAAIRSENVLAVYLMAKLQSKLKT